MEACELYKFIRPSADVLVPRTGAATPPPAAFCQRQAGEDPGLVLTALRSQLRHIWSQLPDARSRKRAVKRLLLKWHPDKNPGREAFCTGVFQHIQLCVSRLEQGLPLPADGEDDVDSYPPDGGRPDRRHGASTRGGRRGHGGGGGGGGGWFGSFFEDVYSRGRSHAQSSGESSYASSSSPSSSSWFSPSSSRPRANPQPEEGRRWMRQARQDLGAARGTLSHGGRGVSNWACYQAHQVSAGTTGPATRRTRRVLGLLAFACDLR